MALTKSPRKRPTAEKLLQVGYLLTKTLFILGPSFITMTLFFVWLFQHAFVTQLLTRNLAIELLDTVNNPDLQQTHTMDESDLEVNGGQ